MALALLFSTLIVGFFGPFYFERFAWNAAALGALGFLSLDNLRTGLQRPLLWGAAYLAICSSAWSTHPQTLTLGLILLADLWLGHSLARLFSVEKALRLTCAALMVFVAAQLLTVGLYPEIGVSEGGQWKGLTVHKNYAGSVSGLAAALFLLVPVGTLPWMLKGVFGFLSLMLLLKAKAVGATLALAAVLAFVILVKLPVEARRLGLGVLLATTALALLNWSTVLGWLGREPQITGRVGLWNVALQAIPESPWFGFGWGQRQPRGFFSHNHAHSFVLTLILQFGLVGTWLLFTDLSAVLIRLKRRAVSLQNTETLAPCAFILYLLAVGLTDSIPGVEHSSLWILYAASSQYLWQQAQGQKVDRCIAETKH